MSLGKARDSSTLVTLAVQGASFWSRISSSYRPMRTERGRGGGKPPHASRILGQKNVDFDPAPVGASAGPSGHPHGSRRSAHHPRAC